MQRILLIISAVWLPLFVSAQSMKGVVRNAATKAPLMGVLVTQNDGSFSTFTDGEGRFEMEYIKEKIPYYINASFPHFDSTSILINQIHQTLTIELTENKTEIEEVVVTGSMRSVSRLESAIPVELYHASYFKTNPTPSLFESIGMINGVRPQINCNVCNTGDIHINGMEGPYTMILIDGMPIVSGLSSVYGLSGIPNSLIEKVELVKGPAGALYGSEAMGGIINVITKNPKNVPLLSAEVMTTTWQEHLLDASYKFRLGKKVTSLWGLNAFNYTTPKDNDKDGFTDMAMQQRISVFNKWNWKREMERVGSIAARYVYENRYGGQMAYNPQLRGSETVYGESIYTNRVELIGQYQFPTIIPIMSQFSYNYHLQDSYYGLTSYLATQQVGFGQLYSNVQKGNHYGLIGLSFRYTHYDDNTPATQSVNGNNKAQNSFLPGLFLQDEWIINKKNTLLAGYRMDYDQYHGLVHSPRIAYKYKVSNNQTLRLSAGTGYRVVNVFTEDHAALTGSRSVEIKNELLPERSFNTVANYYSQIPLNNSFIDIDILGFYTYFTNKILPDYDTDPDKIIYDNLKGNAVSKGVSLNTNYRHPSSFSLNAGITWMKVFVNEENENNEMEKRPQYFAPEWSGNFSISYTFPYRFKVDVTGQWNGPMHLPVQESDPRSALSPWHLIANLQITKPINQSWEIYGGVKNLLNFTPKLPYLRAFDPFDKLVNDPVNNPYGHTFDTEYNYASLQGIRGFLGVRWHID